MSNEILDELTKLSQETETGDRAIVVEKLKSDLDPMCTELIALQDEKEKIDLQLKAINKKIAEQESKIRHLWEPHILGSDKAEIDFGSYKLTTSKKLNVTVDDEHEIGRDAAIQWLISNGYEDTLKYDINTNTLKSIAGEEFKERDVKIPGLKYTYFHPLKVTK